jgi:hypothetical protein
MKWFIPMAQKNEMRGSTSMLSRPAFHFSGPSV